ncbi:hypothetical protein, partial [uncultured Victivallis sp.]|uniref:hypothetical protein n=1 Tax=uncultured Victivallis sp. TaxID=354118 RepID=UPI00258A18A0
DRVFDLSPEEAALLKNILRETEQNDAYSGDFIRCNLKLLLLSILRDSGGAWDLCGGRRRGHERRGQRSRPVGRCGKAARFPARRTRSISAVTMLLHIQVPGLLFR